MIGSPRRLSDQWLVNIIANRPRAQAPAIQRFLTCSKLGASCIKFRPQINATYKKLEGVVGPLISGHENININAYEVFDMQPWPQDESFL